MKFSVLVLAYDDTIVVEQAAALDPAVVRAADTIIVTLATDPREVRTLAAASGGALADPTWASTLGQLDLGEAALLLARVVRERYDFPDVRSRDNPWCLFRAQKSA
ncbi:MAG: hypothetical protein FJW14_13775 [Acidimicrobiia bacterium]|nr:hypothetical protein [Acidimicrobiia bacterium]